VNNFFTALTEAGCGFGRKSRLAFPGHIMASTIQKNLNGKNRKPLPGQERWQGGGGAGLCGPGIDRTIEPPAGNAREVALKERAGFRG